MLRLQGGQVESLWDEVLPEKLRELPDDLARIDALLRDEGLLSPIEAHWQREAETRGRSAKGHGRPTMPMQTYVRLMLLKHRYGWGYETLVREVSDCFHLHRFCLIAIDETMPDESTVRKLTRRLGAETVAELTRALIGKAQRETRFRARAVRIDSTVVEADVRYPTDSGLARAGVRTLAREGRRLQRKAATQSRVRDRSRAVTWRLRAIGRSLRRRTGEAKAEVLALTGQTGRLLAASVKEARALAVEARRRARTLQRAGKEQARREAAKILASAERLETLVERSERVVEQIGKRLAGEPISDRLVSLFDPDARPIRKGKLGRPTEFGYVEQLAEVTPNTKPGTRGFLLPPASAPGNPGENELLPDTVSVAPAAWPLAPGGRARRRLPDESERAGVRPADTRAHLHRRARLPRLETHPATPRPLPDRRRRPRLAPQTPPRPAPQPPQRPRRRAHLDRLEHLHLQHRNIRALRLLSGAPKTPNRSQKRKGAAHAQATSPAHPLPPSRRRLSGGSSLDHRSHSLFVDRVSAEDVQLGGEEVASGGSLADRRLYRLPVHPDRPYLLRAAVRERDVAPKPRPQPAGQ